MEQQSCQVAGGSRWIAVPALRCAWVVCALLLCALEVGCGGGAGRLRAVPGGAGFQPALGEAWLSPCEPGGGVPATGNLARELAQAFADLGIDPDKVAAKAPTGADNAVFDLAASLIDLDGSGGNPPTGVTLTWTERCLGDYDANGEVGYPDLAPLAQHWLDLTIYDGPALHGGLKYWPSGDPEDNGAGSANWVKARLDGDANTEVGTGDVPVIAQHWNERLSGYRMYAKAPGAVSFSLIETLPHPVGSHLSTPVRYSFEAVVTEAGVYSYYVVPVDDAGAEGAASAVVSIDTDTGVVNHAPVAALKVSPEFAGAPATITLDASASYDVDGGGTGEGGLTFTWDFDADGTVDWVSTDTPPEQSSTGLAIEITPGAEPGIVTAQYTQGSAEWYYPRVTAADDDGAESAPARAKLGLSGWEHEQLSDRDDPASLVDFNIQRLSIDPVTEEVLAAGAADYYRLGNYFSILQCARRHAEGNWTQEEVFDPSIEGWGLKMDIVSIYDIFWMPDGQPGILFTGQELGMPGRNRIYVSVRQGTGSWQTQVLWGGESGESSVSYRGHDIIAPGEFVMSCTNKSSTADAYHCCVVWFNQGDITWEDTGIHANISAGVSGYNNVNEIAVDRTGAVCLDLNALQGTLQPELWLFRRIESGVWEAQQESHGELDGLGLYFIEDMKFETDGVLAAVISTYPTEGTVGDFAFLTNKNGQYEVLVREEYAEGNELFIVDNGTAWVSFVAFDNGSEYLLNGTSYLRYEDGKITREIIGYPVYLDPTMIWGSHISTGIALDDGAGWIVGATTIIGSGTPTDPEHYYTNLYHRVDPRF